MGSALKWSADFGLFGSTCKRRRFEQMATPRAWLFFDRRLFHRLRQLRGELFRPREMDAAPEVVAAPRHATSCSALWQAILSPKRRNTWETGELIPIVRPNCRCGWPLQQNSRGELIACPAHDARACLHTSALQPKCERAIKASRRAGRSQTSHPSRCAELGRHCSKRTRPAMATWGVSGGRIFIFLDRPQEQARWMKPRAR